MGKKGGGGGEGGRGEGTGIELDWPETCSNFQMVSILWQLNFFTQSMNEVTMSVVSTSLNIGQQSSNLLPEYNRSIAHLDKWDITPPEYIFIYLRYQGTASSLAQGVGYLIAIRNRRETE